jgi:hypothetical protein
VNGQRFWPFTFFMPTLVNPLASSAIQRLLAIFPFLHLFTHLKPIFILWAKNFSIKIGQGGRCLPSLGRLAAGGGA